MFEQSEETDENFKMESGQQNGGIVFQNTSKKSVVTTAEISCLEILQKTTTCSADASLNKAEVNAVAEEVKFKKCLQAEEQQLQKGEQQQQEQEQHQQKEEQPQQKEERPQQKEEQQQRIVEQRQQKEEQHQQIVEQRQQKEEQHQQIVEQRQQKEDQQIVEQRQQKEEQHQQIVEQHQQKEERPLPKEQREERQQQKEEEQPEEAKITSNVSSECSRQIIEESTLSRTHAQHHNQEEKKECHIMISRTDDVQKHIIQECESQICSQSKEKDNLLKESDHNKEIVSDQRGTSSRKPLTEQPEVSNIEDNLTAKTDTQYGGGTTLTDLIHQTEQHIKDLGGKGKALVDEQFEKISAHKSINEEISVAVLTEIETIKLESNPTADYVHNIKSEHSEIAKQNLFLQKVPQSQEVADTTKKYEFSNDPNGYQSITSRLYDNQNGGVNYAEQMKSLEDIKEGARRMQLQEIINEIDLVVKQDEEQEYVLQHTWQPKGMYHLEKTPIKYEEVIPINVQDVILTDRSKSTSQQTKKGKKKETKFKPVIKKEPEKTLEFPPSKTEAKKECLTPIEIPEGVPLLARLLPKEGEEDGGRGKIPLERLFTAATDSDEISQKKRKLYSSSSFYRTDHPTIEDQVKLAHRISVSLIDDVNKQSKGQSMYMKRKNKSTKWIHTGQWDVQDDDLKPPKQSMELPPLKLLLNPKGIHDYTSVIEEEHFEVLTSSQTSEQISNIGVGKEIVTNLQSPTGKGAALFAKRKKRMDKFIVDETTVQRSAVSKSQLTESVQRETQNSQANSLSMVLNESLLNGHRSFELPETGTMYTAEIKVEETTPIIDSNVVFEFPISHGSLLDMSHESLEDKRKSFNLAAKGWGTYNDFYKPVHLGAE